MSYTQFISRILILFDLDYNQIDNINILVPEGIAVITTSDFRRHTVRISELAADDDYNQDPDPRPIQLRLIKHTQS